MNRENITQKIRLYAVPAVFSLGALLFWLSFREEGSWWWIGLILLIFLLNYGFFEWKNRKKDESDPSSLI